MSAMDFCIRSDLGATNRRHPVPGILRFCNYLQNVGATTCILGLQLSTFIFYNKQSKLLEECITLHGCETGEAKITKAYNLPCEYVIHTVGPIWNGGTSREDELLANCYYNSMKLAMDNGIRNIAFPSISTGVYSFPVELAAKIAVNTINRFLQENPEKFDLVEWVLFDDNTKSVYEAEVDKLYD